MKIIKYFKEHKFLFMIIFAVLFAVYNGIIGLIYKSTWHISIFGYYLLLLIVKCFVIYMETKNKGNAKKEKNVFVFTTILLFIISIALIAPLAIMVLNKRIITFSLEVSIGIAAYTTYKVTISIISYVKRRKLNGIMIRELQTIGIIESIVSILTLQNTLISVNGGSDRSLYNMTIATSFVGWAFILFFLIFMLVEERKNKK